MEPQTLYKAMEPNEPYGTRELADKTGIARRTALNHLNQLASNGEVRKKKIDARRVVWMRPDS